MKLAAIDIGSNAARLLIVNVVVNKFKTAEYEDVHFLRIPLRLGFDVFETGEVSKEKAGKILEAIQVFKSLLTFYDVVPLKACATSALRDAKNGPEIVQKIEEQTGIKINIISGDEEATLIYENHVVEQMDPEHGYLYVDVGGGSTELTFFAQGKLQYKTSINIGAIRLLKNSVEGTHWESMKTLIKENIKSDLPIVAIGSGGNINKIFSMSKKKEGKPLSIDTLKDYYEKLAPLSIHERMLKYKLREDRADVIVPALQIYMNVMRWAGIEDIYVPKIGLVSGLVHALYQELINQGYPPR